MRTLEELLGAIIAEDQRLPRAHGEIDMTNLPTFGGPNPVNTVGIWSWDQTRLLVGDGVNDLEIVLREVAE
jgi:hypothetical protein|tara:strand:+ start:3596 stop:3808 length:213 start_codon:yes stop_codon:yes gene_type:complete